jgi:hypothetical protein
MPDFAGLSCSNWSPLMPDIQNDRGIPYRELHHPVGAKVRKRDRSGRHDDAEDDAGGYPRASGEGGVRSGRGVKSRRVWRSAMSSSRA